MAQLGTTIINGNLSVTGTLTITGSITGVIANADRATKDAAGRTLSSAYAASITLANSILSLKAPDGQTLSTALISTADTLQLITANGASSDKVITLSNATAATSKTTGALKVTGGVGISGDLYANKVIGAYWNDYAENREVRPLDWEIIENGMVVAENGDDTLSITIKRLQPGAKIISDTYGMCIGATNVFTRPIALCGRVLAKPYEDRNRFKDHIGGAVCAAPSGCVSIMSREEIREYPDRIIGYISSVPHYTEWGEAKIKVDGRIWISVK